MIKRADQRPCRFIIISYVSKCSLIVELLPVCGLFTPPMIHQYLHHWPTRDDDSFGINQWKICILFHSLKTLNKNFEQKPQEKVPISTKRKYVPFPGLMVTHFLCILRKQDKSWYKTKHLFTFVSSNFSAGVYCHNVFIITYIRNTLLRLSHIPLYFD